MPLELNGPLAQELMVRQAKEAPSKPDPSKPLSTTMAALLGSAVDGASTYNFMRNGSMVEDNAALGMFGKSPLATGLAAAGTGLAGIGLSKLIGMKYPKLANILLANQAAQQMGMGTQNFARPVNGQSNVETINRGITQAMKPDRFMK